MKNIIVAANWKLNKSPTETRQFFQTFIEKFKKKSSYAQLGEQFQVVFFPQTISLEATSQSLKDSAIKFGAQNIYFQSQGAFTGENSAKVTKELNADFALIGHSERRQYFYETNAFLNKKILHAIKSELAPMYCIGETLEERESGKTQDILLAQIMEGLKDVPAANSKTLVVAYEPVWAIGTGKIATAEQVKETHAFIHKALTHLGLGTTPILYGGSVKAANAQELIQIPHVSGFLVGGASLEVPTFLDLIQNSFSGA